MNFIKNLKITASIFFAAILTISSSVNAATVDMDASGTITGISGIFVDGFGTYDTTFNDVWQGDTYDLNFIQATGDSMMNLFTGSGDLQGSAADLLSTNVQGCAATPDICVGLTVLSTGDDGLGNTLYTGGAFMNYGTDDANDQLSFLTVGDAESPLGTFVSWNQVSPVPEPSTLALMLAGFGLIGFKSHRRNKLSA